MSKVRAASDVTVYVGDQVTGLNVSPQFDGYSKVILNVTKELSYEAGTDTGRTMTLTCPWGTQEMCNNILATIKGYAYQPLEATGAYLDPAAELGDGVTVRDTYTMIGSTKNTFGPMLVTDIVTPHETEINHELPYKSPINREVDRQNASIRSELKIQADKIAAKVEKTGGDISSFGWTMDASGMVWHANSSEIFRLDRDGAKVRGEIIALSGKIGGLEIKNNALSYNQDWGGSNPDGLYVGPNGIQLGKKFKVDSLGNLTANSGTFTGSVYAGSIKSDGVNGYGGAFSGAGILGGSVHGSKLAAHTVTTSYTSNGINASLGYANFSNAVFNNLDTADWLKVSRGLKLGGYWLTLTSRLVEGQIMRYVTWAS